MPVSREWLFGPSSDLRPLPAPDTGIVSTVERFGGAHTSISGAVTVDILGHKSRHEFTLSYLEAGDFERLEALYTRLIPGPLYLVDPLRRNLLSREAASARPAGSQNRGLKAVSGYLDWVRVTDAPVANTQRASSWSNMAATSTVFIDAGRRFPLLPGSDLTTSIYARPNETLTVRWYVQCFRNGVLIDSLTPTSVSIAAGTWSRVGSVVPAEDLDGYDEANVALMYVSGGTSIRTIEVIAPQAEYGPLTDWSLGGGSQRVEFDKMSTSAPWYPHRTVNLSLLEV